MSSSATWLDLVRVPDPRLGAALERQAHFHNCTQLSENSGQLSLCMSVTTLRLLIRRFTDLCCLAYSNGYNNVN